MIVKRRCDKPMAEKKGLLPCSRRCRTCIACIERDEHGDERHVYHHHGYDPEVRARNLRRRWLFYDD